MPCHVSDPYLLLARLVRTNWHMIHCTYWCFKDEGEKECTMEEEGGRKGKKKKEEEAMEEEEEERRGEGREEEGAY